MSRIKNCPHCGCTVFQSQSNVSGMTMFKCFNENCKAITLYDSDSKTAIERFNYRIIDVSDVHNDDPVDVESISSGLSAKLQTYCDKHCCSTCKYMFLNEPCDRLFFADMLLNGGDVE